MAGSPIDPHDLANRFTYHPPTTGQPETYAEVRERAELFAQYLVQVCPPSRELSVAITKLEEVVFWANASVARN